MLARAIFTRIMRGTGCLCILAMGACSQPLDDQLANAKSRLDALSKAGAEHYVPDGVMTVGMHLQVAEAHLSRNNTYLAKKETQQVHMLLDSLTIRFNDQQEQARRASRQFVAFVSQRLDSIKSLASQMPNQSYSDQNRLDIVNFRLLALQRQLQILNQHLASADYWSIQQQAPQIKSTLEDVMAFVLANVPKRAFTHTVSQTNGFEKRFVQNSAGGSQ